MEIISSRSDKKQIVCYIDPDFNEMICQHCLDNDLTRQEILGNAINLALKSHDIDKRITNERKRLTRRPNRKRCVRTGKGFYNREGKTALAGWYPVSSVNSVMLEIARKNINMQELAIEGLSMLCNETYLKEPIKDDTIAENNSNTL